MSVLPKLRLITFNTLENVQHRVGVLLDNKSVIDLTKVSTLKTSVPAAYYDMNTFIEGGKELIKNIKIIVANPPLDSLVKQEDVILKSPIPLPRYVACICGLCILQLVCVLQCVCCRMCIFMFYFCMFSCV